MIDLSLGTLDKLYLYIFEHILQPGPFPYWKVKDKLELKSLDEIKASELD